ncbi:zinc-binding alcohol dehydrogenase [Nesterenkonia sp. F]|uniref:zinc-dependent alcohol dehydrogenase n=1 Tax=Nesterenkonia sp. F TaxID=795955 RepID=UPI000255D233|nr:zinc-binding alcohol dehydrogenase [Nesterenkonia sp. F]
MDLGTFRSGRPTASRSASGQASDADPDAPSDMPSSRTPLSRQYWTVAPGRGEIRRAPVPEPGPGEVLVETLLSGVSRGTETLIHRGEVPETMASRMRAPLQLGDLPHPVSHGYLAVGVVRAGVGPEAEQLIGRTVFCLGGHRDHLVVPAADCHPLPEDCPADRALLAGIAEPALNAIWEAPATLGDRLCIVGAGLVGLTTALLASSLGPERLQVIDVDGDRRGLARRLGLEATTPEEAVGDVDVVFHASATEDGLAAALRLAGDDAVVVEQSWFGRTAPVVPLGADFHARRLRLLASQVGEVAPPRRARRSRRQRLSLALGMLDARCDALLTGRSPLEELPTVMDALGAGDPAWASTLCHVIDHMR